ncbi:MULTISPECIES: hypothetical protein [unclassified Ruegeria]|uniref:hypothetical protein n=1 Tax=unclassified Ruegeria TaxID=2625375 RepID=UPI0014888324|nr:MULTISPECIES: hypothetical protein [unclassified Ruegeria]NOC83140.1 hypothetical protein [Ruegeria sp. HKCCD6428]
MTFLERYNPGLFVKYVKSRQFDSRIGEVFDDLEEIAGSYGFDEVSKDEPATSIVSELIEELQRRIEAVEIRDND